VAGTFPPQATTIQGAPVMGSRLNMFFADEIDTNINSIQGPSVITSPEMKNVVKLKVQLCIAKKKQAWLVDAAEEGWAEDEWEFEGYSGDIASAPDELIYSETEFNITNDQLRLLETHGYFYDDDWFQPIMKLVEDNCEKWGGSLVVKINNRWAIMGFYSD
jgi:hypothetical protein